MVTRSPAPFGSGLPGAGRILHWFDRIAHHIGLWKFSVDVSVWSALVSKCFPIIALIFGAVLLKYGNMLPESRPIASQQTYQSSGTADRIPVLMLRDAAGMHGWDFGDGSLEGQDLSDGLRQAAADGLVSVWGRPRTGNSVASSAPLQIIDPAHWVDYRISDVPLSSTTDNSLVFTYALRDPPRRGGYVDIHVDRPQALKWLRTGALAFKGRNEAARRR